jgi:hypothetical protein
MREAGAPSTGGLLAARYIECAAAPGIVMLAPPEAPRNAEGAQSEGRVGGGRPSTPVQRGQQYKHYRGQSPVEHRPGRPDSCMAYRSGAERRPRPGGNPKSAAKDIIEAETRVAEEGLRASGLGGLRFAGVSLAVQPPTPPCPCEV